MDATERKTLCADEPTPAKQRQGNMILASEIPLETDDEGVNVSGKIQKREASDTFCVGVRQGSDRAAF
jgi:hypothetical protein